MIEILRYAQNYVSSVLLHSEWHLLNVTLSAVKGLAGEGIINAD